MFGAELVSGLQGSGTPPSSLAVSVVAYEQCKLDWSINEPAQQTRIYRNVDGGAFSLLHTVAAGVATYTDTTSQAGISYQYYVRHFDGTRMTNASNTVTQYLEIAIPSNLDGTVISGDAALTWTNGDNAADTLVLRDDVVIATRSPGVTSYTDTTASGEHIYTLVHQRNGNFSDASDPLVLDTGSGGPSAAPSGLFVSTLGPTSLSIGWTNGDSSADTEVERSANGSTGWTNIGTAGAGITSLTDTGRSPGTTYYYKVRHTKNSINSSYSGVASGTTNALPTLSGVSATMHTGGNCTSTYLTNRISYTVSGTTTGFTLEVSCSVNGGGDFVVESRSPATGTTYHEMIGEHLDEAGGDGTTYEYTVRLYAGTQDGTGSPAVDSVSVGVSVCP